MGDPLRLAFITTREHDATNIRSWSGTPYHMAQALLREGVALEYVGPLQTRFRTALRVRARLQRHFGGGYLYDRDPIVLRHYARQIASRLAHLDVDAILCPGTMPVAYLDTGIPVVTWTDATFAAMVDYYPSFSGLSAGSIRAGHAAERAALDRVDAAVFSSSWAAESAIRDYAADPAKVHVVPFGANLPTEPAGNEVEALIEGRPRNECRLLFVGVDWYRKGGDLALEVASRLTRSGIPTKLAVVGCRVPEGSDAGMVESIGFIDKAAPDGEARLVDLLRRSHFFCLPSRADCTPVAFSEASAYGLPSVSVRTGGIGSIIESGKNGYLFGLDDFVEDATRIIRACLADYEGVYAPLARSSYEEYRGRLNWTTSAKTFVGHLSHLVSAGG